MQTSQLKLMARVRREKDYTVWGTFKPKRRKLSVFKCNLAMAQAKRFVDRYGHY